MSSIPLSARALVTAVLVLLVPLLPGRLEGQGVNHLYDKLQIGASAAAVVLSSDIRIDNANGDAGTEINLSDIGISKTVFSPAVAAAWRLPGEARGNAAVDAVHRRAAGRTPRWTGRTWAAPATQRAAACRAQRLMSQRRRGSDRAVRTGRPGHSPGRVWSV